MFDPFFLALRPLFILALFIKFIMSNLITLFSRHTVYLRPVDFLLVAFFIFILDEIFLNQNSIVFYYCICKFFFMHDLFILIIHRSSIVILFSFP
jgi:hypothetical protein